MGPLLIASLIVSLLGLPVAAWFDLRALSERMLQAQVGDINRVIDEVRAFYGSDVVERILSASGPITVTHNYRDIPGAIPIPATLSIELGKLISSKNDAVKYRFVSDHPFKGREARAIDSFGQDALSRLRADPKQPIIEVSGSLLERQIRTAAPVIMGPVCVSCHNAHPDSPKQDWKVGDVRGIQEISVTQPIASNVFSFKYLLSYFAFIVLAGLILIVLQRRQTSLIRGMNRELSEANDFLASVSAKLAKYLSPQVYKSIFSGEKDVTIETERKKLTIFFSDIKDFTAISERLQPEDLTALLNEYFTEMSAIALRHGGTVDKFIGDAILVFFGDPETKGVKEDARACLRMAVDMQQRLEVLSDQWLRRGIEHPFRARMGINTGYCNVGNFGSNDRMEYTIIGAAANLAARLQTIAEPGGICLSYETYALVRDLVQVEPLAPIGMKGIGREIIPYAVKGLSGDWSPKSSVIREHATGLELFIDPDAMSEGGIEQAKRRLSEALAVLNLRTS
ncbi:adenylate/guanylate cyclase domain-containing protein [Microvirga sp. VF16]|uniref:adenylate/guanylate cyclase domain-containing protein n=1 Tax=Microvirga sp. VF16 TaxID=2807101 RepID=UPI00193D8D2F|nr:adenylate/guanylate cyclase domain-containing protein [Microvirga sp. VF16]QRM29373.1 adenylate/guanylate cyclase domain-containing protein [Microvirga sp. VF16]